MYMYIMLRFQCFKIIFDQHDGIKLKHNGVNVKHNRYSLLEFVKSIIGKKFSIMWTALEGIIKSMEDELASCLLGCFMQLSSFHTKINLS